MWKKAQSRWPAKSLIEGEMQECSISSVLVVEIPQSSTEPSNRIAMAKCKTAASPEC